MPTRFIDIAQNVDTIQYLQMLRNTLAQRGVIFERDGKNDKALQMCMLHIRRLQLIEELFVSGHADTTKITCDTCDKRTTCRSAFDIYNTDGDCLEDK